MRLQLRNTAVAACLRVFRQSAGGEAADESCAAQITKLLPKAFDALAEGVVPDADACSTITLREQATCPSVLHLDGLSNRTMLLDGSTPAHAAAVYQTQQDNPKMFGLWLIANTNTPYEHVPVQWHEFVRWSGWAQMCHRSLRVRLSRTVPTK